MSEFRTGRQFPVRVPVDSFKPTHTWPDISLVVAHDLPEGIVEVRSDTVYAAEPHTAMQLLSILNVVLP